MEISFVDLICSLVCNLQWQTVAHKLSVGAAPLAAVAQKGICMAKELVEQCCNATANVTIIINL